MCVYAYVRVCLRFRDSGTLTAHGASVGIEWCAGCRYIVEAAAREIVCCSLAVASWFWVDDLEMCRDEGEEGEESRSGELHGGEGVWISVRSRSWKALSTERWQSISVLNWSKEEVKCLMRGVVS